MASLLEEALSRMLVIQRYADDTAAGMHILALVTALDFFKAFPSINSYSTLQREVVSLRGLSEGTPLSPAVFSMVLKALLEECRKNTLRKNQ